MRHLKFLSIPYFIWMIILVVIPSLIILLVAFSNFNVFNPGAFSFNFDSIKYILDNDSVQEALSRAVWNSIRLSVLATIICLLIGYPIAYYIPTGRTLS